MSIVSWIVRYLQGAAEAFGEERTHARGNADANQAAAGSHQQRFERRSTLGLRRTGADRLEALRGPELSLSSGSILF